MTIVDKACYESGCAFYDDRVDKDGVAVVAQRAVDAEREAIAKMIEDWDSDSADPRDIAAAIRARGTRPTSVIYSPGELAARGLTHEDVVKLIKENT